MMGPRQEAQAALFYEFSLEDHVPQAHLLRSIDRFVDLSSIRAHLSDFHNHTRRPSVDPELLMRILLVGYCFGIRSERRLCEEVHLNLAYRWFCRLARSHAEAALDRREATKRRHLEDGQPLPPASAVPGGHGADHGPQQEPPPGDGLAVTQAGDQGDQCRRDRTGEPHGADDLRASARWNELQTAGRAFARLRAVQRNGKAQREVMAN